jgi:hypothetical protein
VAIQRSVDSRLAREPAREPTPPQPAERDPADVVDDVGGRIQEIVDEAERVGALTESLGFRIESLQRDAQALVDVLDEARRSLTALADVATPESRQDEDAGQPAPEAPAHPQPPRPRPVPDAAPAPEPDRVPDQAILRATQMAVAGTERTEIEQMLRDEFGVTNARAVVDQMLRSGRA